MDREGAVHRGVELRFGGQGHRIDLADLTGQSIVVYGQQEVVKDLNRARLDAGGEILFETAVTCLEVLETEGPRPPRRLPRPRGGRDPLPRRLGGRRALL